MDKNKRCINIAQIIRFIDSIESNYGIKNTKYGLYDKDNQEFITEQNKHDSIDYYKAYRYRCNYMYAYDKALDEDVISYLLNHHGQIYFAMLKKGTRKAFVVNYDMDELIEKYGDKIKPKSTNRKKKSTQCEGQLVLPFV